MKLDWAEACQDWLVTEAKLPDGVSLVASQAVVLTLMRAARSDGTGCLASARWVERVARVPASRVVRPLLTYLVETRWLVEDGRYNQQTRYRLTTPNADTSSELEPAEMRTPRPHLDSEVRTRRPHLEGAQDPQSADEGADTSSPTSDRKEEEGETLDGAARQRAVADFHAQVVSQLSLGGPSPTRLARNTDAVAEVLRLAANSKLYNGSWSLGVAAVLAEPDDDPDDFNNPLGVLLHRLRGVSEDLALAAAAEHEAQDAESTERTARDEQVLAWTLVDLRDHGEFQNPRDETHWREHRAWRYYDKTTNQVTEDGHALLARVKARGGDVE